MPPLPPSDPNDPTLAAMLPLVDAAGILSARMAIMPAAGATSDAIEEFEDAARRLRTEQGDKAADCALALIDTAGLMPRPD